MAAPTFVNEYESTWNSATSPKSVSVDVNVGDVLVVYGLVENNTTTLNTPTMTGVTWTLRNSQTAGGSAEAGAYIWTGTATQAGTFSLQMTRTGNDFWGFSCLRFSGSSGIGAATGTQASNVVSLGITTTGDNSAIVVANCDWNAVDGTTRTWLTVNGITPSSGNGGERSYFRDASHYTLFGAYYSDAGSAGAKTVGISAPTAQEYAIVAVEVLGSSGSQFAVSGTSAATSASQLDVNAKLVASGTTAAVAGSELDVTALIPVSGTIAAVAGSSLDATLVTGPRDPSELGAVDATLNNPPWPVSGTVAAVSATSLNVGTTSSTDYEPSELGTVDATLNGIFDVSGTVAAVSGTSLNATVVADFAPSELGTVDATLNGAFPVSGTVAAVSGTSLNVGSTAPFDPSDLGTVDATLTDPSALEAGTVVWSQSSSAWLPARPKRWDSVASAWIDA